jgi:hypothetical protein
MGSQRARPLRGSAQEDGFVFLADDLAAGLAFAPAPVFAALARALPFDVAALPFVGSTRIAPGRGAMTVARPLSQRMTYRGGSSLNTSSITPARSLGFALLTLPSM